MVQKIKDDANNFPAKYLETLSHLGIDSDPNSGSFDEVRRFVYLFGAAVQAFTITLCVMLLPAVYSAARIVTVYQIVVVCTRAMAVLFITIGITLVVLAYS